MDTTQEVLKRLRLTLADAICGGNLDTYRLLLRDNAGRFEDSSSISFMGKLLAEIINRKSGSGVQLFLQDSPRKDLSQIFGHQDSSVQLAMHHAVLTQQPTIIALLASYGAKLSVPDRENKLPLDRACERFDMTSDLSQETIAILLRLHAGLGFDFISYAHCYDYIQSLDGICLFGARFPETINDQAPHNFFNLAMFDPEEIIMRLVRPEFQSDADMSTLIDAQEMVSYLAAQQRTEPTENIEFPTEPLCGADISLRRQLEWRCSELFSTTAGKQIISPLYNAVFSDVEMVSQDEDKAQSLMRILRRRVDDLEKLVEIIDAAGEKIEKKQKLKKGLLATVLFVVPASIATYCGFSFMSGELMPALTLLSGMSAIFAPLGVLGFYHPKPPLYYEAGAVVNGEHLSEVLVELGRMLASDPRVACFNTASLREAARKLKTLTDLKAWVQDVSTFYTQKFNYIELGGDVSVLELESQPLLENAENEPEHSGLGDVWLDMEPSPDDDDVIRLDDYNDSSEEMALLGDDSMHESPGFT